ncbi:PAS domain-containing sensor histidine kinase [Actinomadura violacea]|uniref:Sensor-like histidine kinase SenX3 n=1 Tax=Actinomadura violacea TaxID=2819934 RepID=A0ABS3S2W6_9ACTN|nr:PAS domain-containing sensor histidine kinase [Actinomadura violacea]MBO2463251.1 PAS domain-containing sensor histidine kinase [Actinomadura violacea]
MRTDVFWSHARPSADLALERSNSSAPTGPSDIAVLAMEPSGRVVAWNPAMARLAGTPAARAVGRRVTDLFTLTDEGGEAVDLAGMRSGIARMTMSGGRSLRVEVSCSASAGAPAGSLLTAVFVDRTAGLRLDHGRHLKLVSAQHELHAPLTMIHGHAQLLDDVVTEENAKKSLEAIHDAVEMMRRVIADLVVAINADLPAVRAVPTTELVDVPSLVRRTLQSVPPVANRSLLSAPRSLFVHADPVRLRQCLLLVLGNVEKYAPEGRVSITVRTEGEHGSIVIADEGPGIPEDELDQVLKPYYRSAATENLPGTGLGLHIAEAAISAMHGRIELASPQSGGLRVALHLPLAQPGEDQKR